MIISRTGEIADGIHLLGHHGFPVFLVDGDRPALFDAGLAFLGPEYVRQIKAVLGHRQPAWCFLSHSHFDHCSAVSCLKTHFPGMQVVGSPKAAEILARPNAVALISRLNQSALELAPRLGVEACATPFEPFQVDRIAREGDRFELSPALTLQVLETPGHTWDFLSYYLPERKLLVASEAVGTREQRGYIMIDCLVDFACYYQSIQRLCGLDVEILFQGHIYAFTGRDARDHLNASLDESLRFKARVKQFMEDAENDIQVAMQRFKLLEWESNPGLRQPEPAYLLNLEARINTVMRALAADAGEPHQKAR